MHVMFVLPKPLKLICKVLKYKYSNALCCILHEGSIRQLTSNLNLGGGGEGRISIKNEFNILLCTLFYVEYSVHTAVTIFSAAVHL